MSGKLLKSRNILFAKDGHKRLQIYSYVMMNIYKYIHYQYFNIIICMNQISINHNMYYILMKPYNNKKIYNKIHMNINN